MHLNAFKKCTLNAFKCTFKYIINAFIKCIFKMDFYIFEKLNTRAFQETTRKQLNVKGKRVKMLILTRFYPFKHMFNRVFLLKTP